MTENVGVSYRWAEELRHEFDLSFTQPPDETGNADIGFLAIGIGEIRYALRLSEIAGLYTGKRITPVPGAKPVLIGIAGFRGTVAPVYDFGRLMGHAAGKVPRYLVLAAAEPVALAFDTFAGQFRAQPDAIRFRQDKDKAHGFTGELVQTGDGFVSIIDLKAVVGAIAADT